MRLRLTLILFFCCAVVGVAQRPVSVKAKVAEPVDTVSVLQRYMHQMDSLVYLRDSVETQDGLQLLPDPYYFQLLSTPTLYSGPVHMMFVDTDSTASDRKLQTLRSTYRFLAHFYCASPWMVSCTETDLKEQPSIREDVVKKMDNKNVLADKVQTKEIKPEMDADDKIEVVTRRPNFWKFPGNTSLNFTQNYYTENWRADNKYSGSTVIILNANFDDEKKLIWTNNLDFRLGFQTDKNDKKRAFRPTSNEVKYNTNIGYRAIKSWYYSVSVNMKTKIVKNYDANSDFVNSDFLSPLDVTIAPGMTYNFAYGKKKRFTGNMNLAPLAYNICYVQRNNLVQRYGIDKGHHSRHSFGPNMRINYNWNICKLITWNSTIFWYSNLSRTEIDWSNTFCFAFSKYINAQLFVHPVFRDDNPSWKSKKTDYLRVEQQLSLGVTYNF